MDSGTENYIDEIALAIYNEGRAKQNWEYPDELAIGLYRNYALLVLTVGHHVTNEHVHDAWSAWRVATMPLHRSAKPFAELTPDVQDLDTPYREAIARVARGLGR